MADEAQGIIDEIRVEEEARSLAEQVDREREAIRELLRKFQAGGIDVRAYDEAAKGHALQVVALMDRIDALDRGGAGEAVEVDASHGSDEDAPATSEAEVLRPAGPDLEGVAEFVRDYAAPLIVAGVVGLAAGAGALGLMAVSAAVRGDRRN